MSSTQPSSIIGSILYHFELTKKSAAAGTSNASPSLLCRKRMRSLPSCDNNIVNKDATTTIVNNNVNEDSHGNVIGWIFRTKYHPQECSRFANDNHYNDDKYYYYLLSVPKQLQQLSFQASSSGCCGNSNTVRMTNYQLIPFRKSHHDEKRTILRMSQPPEKSVHNDTTRLSTAAAMDIVLEGYLLEVLTDGMEMIPINRTCNNNNNCCHCTMSATKSNHNNTCCNNAIEYCTLSEIAKIESLFDKKQQPPNDASKTYNFHGIVDSISPIITMDRNDPFAIIELVSSSHKATTASSKDVNGTPLSPTTDQYHSCIIILRKSAFECMEAIQPGNELQLYNVQRQKWKIPHILRQCHSHDDELILQLRLQEIPNYVFMMDDASAQIHWQPRPILSDFNFAKQPPNKQLKTSSTNYCSVLYDNVVSIQGKIISVRSKKTVIRNNRQKSMPSKKKNNILNYNNEGEKQHQQDILHYIEILLLDRDYPLIQNDDESSSSANHVNRTNASSSNNCNENNNNGCDFRKNHIPKMDYNDSIIIRLYVTYFPMSNSVVYSLRQGAIIQVSNIQLIQCIPQHWMASYYFYGTSLRSHISIISMSPSTTTTATLVETDPKYCWNKKQFNNRNYNNTTIRINNVLPYQFPKTIKISYTEFVWRCQLQAILDQFQMDRIRKTAAQISHDNIATTSQHLLRIDDLLKSLPKLLGKQLHAPTTTGTTDTTISNDKSKGIFSTKDTTSKALRHLRPVRNPYSEFFLHDVTATTFQTNKKSSVGSDFCVDDDVIKPLMLLSSSEQQQSVEEMDNEWSERNGDHNNIPQPVCLEQIHKYAFEEIIQRVRNQTVQSSHELYIGWMCSFVLSDEAIMKSLFQMNAPTDLYAVGYAQLITVNDSRGMEFARVSNGRINHIPVHFVTIDDTMLDKNNNRLKSNTTGDGFAWIRIRCIHCTCTCIGGVASNNDQTTTTTTNQSFDSSTLSTKIQYFPVFNNDWNNNDTKGPCALLIVNGYVYVTSLFIECDKLVYVDNTDYLGAEAIEQPPNSLSTNFQRHESIENCMLWRKFDIKTDTFFDGLLVRKFFKPTWIKNKCDYSGCMLTLANYVDENIASSHEDVVTSQAIDIKPVIVINKTILANLRDWITKSFHRIVLSDGQLSLACAVWTIAISEKHCALLAGGWDEFVPGGALCGFQRGVVVRVPMSTLHHDKKRGYVRYRGNMDDLVASIKIYENRPTNPTSPRTGKGNLFDFVSYRQFLPGMQDQRPRRICFGDVKHGELLVCHPRNYGISMYNLASLHWAACQDVQAGSSSNLCYYSFLSPSLVREIHGTFLGISFCRAIAECTKCFSTLQLISPSAINPRARHDSTITHGPTYWHLPKPSDMKHELYTGPMNTADTETVALQQTSSTVPKKELFLCCPNNCRVEQYGAIKWECSGTIDDTTGQAKLYAERDVALCLLGMSSSTIKVIEEGAWRNENGIVYTKSMPPKSTLRDDIETARANLFRSRVRLTRDAVLSQLSVTARADYLLQEHCRSSILPNRDMIYLVRCKPLSDDMSHLNHTKIDLAGSSRMTTYTYSLPPLKLNLVDCAIKE